MFKFLKRLIGWDDFPPAVKNLSENDLVTKILVQQVLLEMRAILDSPEKWIKYSFAASTHLSGRPTHPLSSTANCFCLLGAQRLAMFRVVPHDMSDAEIEKAVYDRLLNAIYDLGLLDRHAQQETTKYMLVSGFNDSEQTKFEHIKLILDRAILEES